MTDWISVQINLKLNIQPEALHQYGDSPKDSTLVTEYTVPLTGIFSAVVPSIIIIGIVASSYYLPGYRTSSGIKNSYNYLLTILIERIKHYI